MTTPTSRLAVLVPLLLLGGCATTVGSPGPAGPAGPAGPPGPVNAGPFRLSVLTVAVNTTVGAATDVLIVTQPVVITLPPAAEAGAGRTLTIRNRLPGTSGENPVIRTGTATDRLENESFFSLDRNEMVTLVSDGVSQWTVISASDL